MKSSTWAAAVHPGQREGVQQDGPVGPPRLGCDRGQLASEQILEYRLVQAVAQSARAQQRVVHVPQYEQLGHGPRQPRLSPRAARGRTRLAATGHPGRRDTRGPQTPAEVADGWADPRRGYCSRSRAIPIDEVVGEYLQLKNAGGGSLKGLCPFHDEKTPSFNVTPARGLFYCLAGETRVLTWEGVKPIRELAGGTHRILGKHGDWIEAPFRSFGVQPLMRLTLTRNGISKHIYATAEHRWFVRSGRTQKSDREVVTSDLRPGHRLVSKFPRTRVKQTTPSPFGIAHGLAAFGDSTRNGTGSMAQLDAVKDVELLKWFPVSMMTQHHGRQMLIHHLPRFFKELPPLDESVVSVRLAGGLLRRRRMCLSDRYGHAQFGQA